MRRLQKWADRLFEAGAIASAVFFFLLMCACLLLVAGMLLVSGLWLVERLLA